MGLRRPLPLLGASKRVVTNEGIGVCYRAIVLGHKPLDPSAWLDWTIIRLVSPRVSPNHILVDTTASYRVKPILHALIAYTIVMGVAFRCNIPIRKDVDHTSVAANSIAIGPAPVRQ
jgi:hypothetical protein